MKLLLPMITYSLRCLIHYSNFSVPAQLLSVHQQELDEMMEKMETEKQRQRSNLHQKLMERKKQKLEAQKRKQEREMAKELLEQKKELAEVRSEHVSSICLTRENAFLSVSCVTCCIGACCDKKKPVVMWF